MPLRLVEMELVEYRTHEIGYTTSQLIHNFAEYSGIAGVEPWPNMLFGVLDLIRDRTPFNCIWEVDGMDINFSSFLEPQPHINKDGSLVYSSPEPRFVFLDRPELMRHALKTHVGRVTEAIAREMQEVYHLRIERNPLALVFPKEEYASRVDHHLVPLLSS